MDKRPPSRHTDAMTAMTTPPGLIIAAPASGCGKTTVTLGLLAALRAQGLRVMPFKNGPDYIDPAFHAVAAGHESVNLDSWAMSAGQIGALLNGAQGADIFVTEGSMGLFDGVSQPGEAGGGSGADLAAMMGWPVVLVLDVSAQAQSAGAVALGFDRLRPGVRLAGVILNKVASPSHDALCREGLAQAGLPVLGSLPRNSAIGVPERHLGLVQAAELPRLHQIIDEAARFVGAHVDLGAIVAAARMGARPTGAFPPLPVPGGRIALARDAAFSFNYPHLVAGWRAAGATILPFSPLADEAPDDSADCCWLPGGYPELHAGRLAAATGFRTGITRFAQTRPVHGECGGYMVMGAGLVDAQGQRHPMLGLLGLETSFAQRRLHLGYRTATLRTPIPGVATGTTLRGHEFHYATILAQPDAPLAEVRDAQGRPVPETGAWRDQPGGGRVTGSFFHLIAVASATVS